MKHDDLFAEGSSGRFGKSDLVRLGHFLRARRKAIGMTLRRLSELSGVGIASIRAIETASASSSLTNVLNVADALGLTIDEAIEGGIVDSRRVVVSRAQDSGRPADDLEDPALEVRILALEPGSVQTVPPSMSGAPTLCYVLQGAVITSLDQSRRVLLGRGDAYHARADRVSAWANPGSEPARLLCVADRTDGPEPVRRSP